MTTPKNKIKIPDSLKQAIIKSAEVMTQGRQRNMMDEAVKMGSHGAAMFHPNPENVNGQK